MQEKKQIPTGNVGILLARVSHTFEYFTRCIPFYSASRQNCVWVCAYVRPCHIYKWTLELASARLRLRVCRKCIGAYSNGLLRLDAVRNERSWEFGKRGIAMEKYIFDVRTFFFIPKLNYAICGASNEVIFITCYYDCKHPAAAVVCISYEIWNCAFKNVWKRTFSCNFLCHWTTEWKGTHCYICWAIARTVKQSNHSNAISMSILASMIDEMLSMWKWEHHQLNYHLLERLHGYSVLMQLWHEPHILNILQPSHNSHNSQSSYSIITPWNEWWKKIIII